MAIKPTHNIYWKEIPWHAKISLHGNKGSQYYVASFRGNGKGFYRRTVYWMGNEAQEAQSLLDKEIASRARGKKYHKRPRAYGGR